MLRLSVTSEVDTLLSRFDHSSTSKLSEQGVDGSRGALLKFVFKRWETYGNRRRAMPGSHAEPGGDSPINSRGVYNPNNLAK